MFTAFVIAALAVSAAFALRNTVYKLVILPLAYLWWLIGLFYRFIPQVFFWFVLIFIVLYTAVRTLLVQIPLPKETKQVRVISRGPIENLSALMDKRKYGNYYRWLIANRLGKVARELLDQREGRSLGRRLIHFTGRDWHPPDEVAAYLEAGLNSSFADYPRPRWMRARPTPLDEAPQHVIEYLESELEARHNGTQ